MEKLGQIYEGKAKKVFRTSDPNAVIVEYKDDATAFDGKKRGTIVGKGVVNNRVSNHFFKILEKNGIPTHYIDELSERETSVKKVSIVPLEVIVRNVAAGSFSKRYNVEEGRILARTILEFCVKDDALGDPFINTSGILALELASEADVERICSMTLKINQILRENFKKIGVELVDFKLEFGRAADGEIILADEISPDTCRLWDVETHKKLDKDRFRRDLGDVVEAYEEIYRRIFADA